MKDIIIRLAIFIYNNAMFLAMLFMLLLLLVLQSCAMQSTQEKVNKQMKDLQQTEWVKAAREARHTTTLSSYVTR